MCRIVLRILLLLPVFATAQNLPQCDSLVITCCAFDSLGSNTISIYVANPSSELFDYPGFILLDDNLDTIAKEIVNYFGIGTWQQAHTMTIVAPLSIPFTGYLELHTLFYQEFACSFPFTIADTATDVNEIPAAAVTAFPNPCSDELHLRLSHYSSGNELQLSLVDVAGKEMFSIDKSQLPVTISTKNMPPGLYFLRISDLKNNLLQFQKIVVCR